MTELPRRYYSLSDEGKVFGLISVDRGVMSRYLPDKGVWTEAPSEWDYITGNEPGSKSITEAEAKALMRSPDLVVLDQEAIDMLANPEPKDG